MARPERFELPTLCLEGRCSIHLSYGRAYFHFNAHCLVPILLENTEIQRVDKADSQF
jgi:hypothetical protein